MGVVSCYRRAAAGGTSLSCNEAMQALLWPSGAGGGGALRRFFQAIAMLLHMSVRHKLHTHMTRVCSPPMKLSCRNPPPGPQGLEKYVMSKVWRQTFGVGQEDRDRDERYARLMRALG